jgi:hypothetical protein
LKVLGFHEKLVVPENIYWTPVRDESLDENNQLIVHEITIVGQIMPPETDAAHSRICLRGYSMD